MTHLATFRTRGESAKKTRDLTELVQLGGLAVLQDPAFQSEKEFQGEVVTQIRSHLDRHAPHEATFGILEGFGLDLCVFLRAGAQTVCRFVEFKAFTGQRMGGVGFGNGRGHGPQVDLLMLPDPMIQALESTIRWCMADLTKPQGAKRYAVLTSVQAKYAAMGIIAHNKQNNFRTAAVFANPLAWSEFVDQLERFLLPTPAEK